MKKFLSILVLLFTISSQSQTNSLLDRAFWSSKPDLNTVKSEISKGNSPSELNSSAFDPVVLAINGQASNDIIKYLLNLKGNDVNKITHDGRTYIFWAASKGNLELMQHLVDKGANMKHIDEKGYSVLNFAATSGQTNTKIYDLCIAKGLNPKTDLDTEGANALLLIAPHDKELTLINYFVSKGVNLKSADHSGNTAFNYAARTGNLATLKLLAGKGVKHTDNALIIASQGGRGTANKLEVYQYFETLGMNPNTVGKNGENVFHGLVRKEKQGEIIQYFLSKGVDINKIDNDGNTPLMNAAAANADIEVLKLIVGKTKDINQKNKKGVSALAFAVKNNTAEVVKLLVDSSADYRTVDANNDNLAVYLFQSYNPKKVAEFEAKLQILQAQGFDVSVPQKSGKTLYHLAVSKNDINLLKFVQSFPIDVNAKDSEGMTALHNATLTAKDDLILKQLLYAGAKKDLTTDLKETAYDLALENEFLNKNKEALKLLK